MHTRDSEPGIRHDNGRERANGRHVGRATPVREEIEHELEAAQVRFVDNPREAVEAMERVVERIVAELTAQIASLRESAHAVGNGEGTTERLRQAIQRYRDIAHRLLRV